MGPEAVEIQAADDGSTFHPVARFGANPMDAGLYSVPAFTSRFCRVVLIRSGGPVVLHALHVGARAEVERIARLAAKSLRSSSEGMSNTTVSEQGEFVWHAEK